MEDMNQLQRPLNLQARFERQFSGQERNYQVLKSLCELQSSLINHFISVYQSRAASLIQEQKNETWRRNLNWENPRIAEYESVLGILRQQKELLEEDFERGRDTSISHLLLDLLRSLWKYLLFNSRIREVLRPNVTRPDSHTEWGEFDQGILLLSANLPQNVYEGETIFEQHNIRIILNYLKQSTPVPRTDTESTRYNEDQEFDILNAHPAL